jgi:hypothetical protein
MRGRLDVTGLKVVHITPIGRGRRALGHPFHHVADERPFAGPDRTRHIEIEAGALHLQTEFQGLDRSLLSDDFVQGLQFTGIVESQLRRIDGWRQHGDGDFESVDGHPESYWTMGDGRWTVVA